MSWLSTLFKGGKNPANAGMGYLDQIPGMGHQNYDPYIDRGNNASNSLNEQFMKMMSDPQGFLAQMQSGYKTSDAYKNKSEELQKGMGAAAAAGGLAGTPYHQQQYGEEADKLLSGDMQQYLDNVMGINKTGLSGEQDFANKGFDATKALTDLLGGTLGSKSTLGFEGVKSQNQNQNAFINALMQALSQGAGGAFGAFGGK